MERKRKSSKNLNTESACKRKVSSRELSAYFKSYKNGFNDIHWPIFREIDKIIKPSNVLYPGCHRHITASLVFKDVVYVDNYKKVEPCYSDPKVLEWLNSNKEYNEEMKINFLCKNFEKDFGEPVNSFDLVISMSAGIVSSSCAKYVKNSGYFLASDAHFDARMLSLRDDFELTHVWDASKKCFLDTEEELHGHFMTIKDEKLSKQMVDESLVKPKGRRSFKLKKEAMFYLFKKIK